MARPKKKPAARARNAEVEVLEPDETEETREESEIERIVAAIGAFPDPHQLRITVSRHAPGNRYGPKYNYVFASDTSEAADLLEIIRARCGGGVFKIRITKRDGTFVFQEDLAVEGDPILTGTTPAIATTLPATIAPASSGNLEHTLQAFMAASAENQRQLIAALAPQRSADPIDLFKQFAAITTGMRAGASEASGAGMVETIKAAMNLAREMNTGGDSGGGSNVWDVVKSVLENPGILDGLKAIAENMRSNGVTLERPAMRPAIAAAPGPAIPDPAPPAPAPGQPMTGEQMLEAYIPMLVQKARVNANPALYAEFLLDNLVPDLARALIYQPDIIGTLTNRFPEIGPVRQWFDKLLDELRAMQQDSGEAPGGADSREPSQPLAN